MDQQNESTGAALATVAPAGFDIAEFARLVAKALRDAQYAEDAECEAPRPKNDAGVLAIAEVCHEANRVYCLLLGDDSQPRWEDAPDWQKGSAIEGVHAHLDNPYMRPSESHESWLYHKLKEGWTWGPVKDPEKKQHPCMVPYQELPRAQRGKDVIFGGLVKVLKDFAYAPGSAPAEDDIAFD